jgi:hypothetical protein
VRATSPEELLPFDTKSLNRNERPSKRDTRDQQDYLGGAVYRNSAQRTPALADWQHTITGTARVAVQVACRLCPRLESLKAIGGVFNVQLSVFHLAWFCLRLSELA